MSEMIFRSGTVLHGGPCKVAGMEIDEPRTTTTRARSVSSTVAEKEQWCVDFEAIASQEREAWKGSRFERRSRQKPIARCMKSK
jgi:hypothetical protein